MCCLCNDGRAGAFYSRNYIASLNLHKFIDKKVRTQSFDANYRVIWIGYISFSERNSDSCFSLPSAE